MPLLARAKLNVGMGMLSSDKLISWIDYALQRPMPREMTIVPNGPNRTDVFSVCFTNDEGSYRVIGRDGEWLECLRFDNRWGTQVHRVSVFEAWLAKPEIKHFVGIYNITWVNWAKFARDQVFKLDYAQVWLEGLRNKWRERRLAGRKIQVQRMSLLVAAYDWQLTGEDSPKSMDLASKLHGEWIFGSGDFERVMRAIDVLLEGLVDTGHLKKEDYKYKLTGKGIEAIDEHASRERKHRDGVRLQRVMAWLTAMLLVSAIVQSGLVRVGTLISFGVEKPMAERDSDASCVQK